MPTRASAEWPSTTTHALAMYSTANSTDNLLRVTMLFPTAYHPNPSLPLLPSSRRR